MTNRNREEVAFNRLPQGSIPALVPPMHEDGSLDWDSYCRLIDWHVAEGSDGLVVMGSTGEAATVSMDEHSELIRVAIELAGFARKWGAIAALSIVPYYNKPSQEGIFQHFCAIAEAVDLPLILYNVPGRSVVDLANETILRLSVIPNIVGLKDATGDIGRAIALFARLRPNFAVYSGDDPTASALIMHGGRGNISVTANVIPEQMARLCAAARVGDLDLVRRLDRRIAPLHDALFIDSNPIPVKWALAHLGKIEAFCRLPMTPLAQQHHATIKAALADAMATDAI